MTLVADKGIMQISGDIQLHKGEEVRIREKGHRRSLSGGLFANKSCREPQGLQIERRPRTRQRSAQLQLSHGLMEVPRPIRLDCSMLSGEVAVASSFSFGLVRSPSKGREEMHTALHDLKAPAAA
jgi:hypothetical protein